MKKIQTKPKPELHRMCDVEPDVEANEEGSPLLCDLDVVTVTKSAVDEFVTLDLETRVAVDTDAAARHLNRQPQTLRKWACYEDGPIRPLRIHGRLAWRVNDLRRVLGCGLTSNVLTAAVINYR